MKEGRAGWGMGMKERWRIAGGRGGLREKVAEEEKKSKKKTKEGKKGKRKKSKQEVNVIKWSKRKYKRKIRKELKWKWIKNTHTFTFKISNNFPLFVFSSGHDVTSFKKSASRLFSNALLTAFYLCLLWGVANSGLFFFFHFLFH